MMPVAVKGPGQCTATVPDVCKTPPPPPGVPIPYPNIAQNSMATASTVTKKVKVNGMAAFLKGTEIPMSQGDEPGVLKGVASSTNMNKMKVADGSSVVYAEGKNLATALCPTKHNGASPNAPMGMIVSPGQATVLAAF